MEAFLSSYVYIFLSIHSCLCFAHHGTNTLLPRIRILDQVMPFAIDPRAPKGHPMHGPAAGLRLKVYGASKERALNDWNDEWDDDWDVDPAVLEAARLGIRVEEGRGCVFVLID